MQISMGDLLQSRGLAVSRPLLPGPRIEPADLYRTFLRPEEKLPLHGLHHIAAALAVSVTPVPAVERDPPPAAEASPPASGPVATPAEPPAPELATDPLDLPPPPPTPTRVPVTEPQPMPLPDLTAHDVATMIGMSPQFVYKEVARKRIRHRRRGRSVYFTRAWVDEYLRGATVAASNAPAAIEQAW
jgi:hypothetical protein